MNWTVCRKFTFEASHYLGDGSRKSKKEFGKCCNMHGHSYKLYVYLHASQLKHGMVLNFSKVKEIVNKEIVDKLDHQVLNHCEMFNGVEPTAEYMCSVIYSKLRQHFGISLKKIRIYETEKCYAEYGG